MASRDLPASGTSVKLGWGVGSDGGDWSVVSDLGAQPAKKRGAMIAARRFLGKVMGGDLKMSKVKCQMWERGVRREKRDGHLISESLTVRSSLLLLKAA